MTVPLVKRSQNKKINEHFIFEKPLFHKHFSKILIESYSNNLAYDFVDKHNNFSKNLSIYNVEGIKFCMNYLNIKRKIIYSSDLNINLNGKDRIIEICKVLNAKFYVNLPGGKSLYKKSDFEKENIQLKFIENKSKSVFNYSILHDILSLDRNKLIEKLENYEVS